MVDIWNRGGEEERECTSVYTSKPRRVSLLHLLWSESTEEQRLMGRIFLRMWDSLCQSSVSSSVSPSALCVSKQGVSAPNQQKRKEDWQQQDKPTLLMSCCRVLCFSPFGQAVRDETTRGNRSQGVWAIQWSLGMVN